MDTSVLFATLDAIRAQPEIARFQFRAVNEWIAGAHNRSTIKGFYAACSEDSTRTEAFTLDAGEPAILLGTDTGPNPAEFLLHALAACVTTSLVYAAAARKVRLTSVRSTLRGDLDVHGAMGLDESYRSPSTSPPGDIGRGRCDSGPACGTFRARGDLAGRPGSGPGSSSHPSEIPMTPIYDVVVVGARCAGASTAMLLARAGLSVLVLEAARPGADTLSTHALMRGGVIQLHRWGLLDAVRDAGTPAITRTDFHYGKGDVATVEIRGSTQAPALFAPRRTVLDTLLADAARTAGADVRFGARVTGLLRSGERVIGATWREAGTERSARAFLVIGADGRRSTVAELVGAGFRHLDAAAGAILLQHRSGLEQSAYQWFYGNRASAGVVPTNDGLACVWVGLPARTFAARSASPAELYSGLVGRVAPELEPGRDVGLPVRAYPGFGGFVRESSGPGWALVGDAGYYKDPITAHGMTDALRDAELLSRAVLATERPDDRVAALRDYERSRDELSAGVRRLTARIARYDWRADEIRLLLADLSAAMRPEVDALLALDREPAAA